MKWIIPPTLLLLNFTAIAAPTPADTTIRGVTISFKYHQSIFPSSWQAAPISAAGERIDAKEIVRCNSIIDKALRKYPTGALANDLQVIYFLKSMKFYDVGYGGTNSTDALYLTNNGESMGYTDLYLEQTFHHEYSSILFRNHPEWLDQKAWMAANLPGFDYNDPENGVGAIRNNASSQELDNMLCQKGFLTQYAQSSLENDINTFAQNLFSPSEGFWQLIDQYPRVNKKMKLLVRFYNRIDPAFTETYFRNLNN
jgi:hypothetical protein